MLMIACVVNLTWGRHMNTLEALVLLVQFAAFFLVLVVLAMASSTNTLPASFTFATETGYSRWVGALLGLSYCTGVLGGFDCATHLAEDTEDPRKEIPRSLLLSTTVNSLTCIVVAILVTFCAGDPKIFSGPLAISGHPLGTVAQLLLDATRGNRNIASAVWALCAIIFAVCTANTMTTASRMLFSLVRDGRDPVVTKVLAKDLNEQGLPRICILIVATLPVIILWINFVSAVGFQAIVSQVTLALVITYFMVFASSLDARIHRPELLGYNRGGWWEPGRSLGIAMDVTAMVFLFIIGLISWSVQPRDCTACGCVTDMHQSALRATSECRWVELCAVCGTCGGINWSGVLVRVGSQILSSRLASASLINICESIAPRFHAKKDLSPSNKT